MGHTGNIKGGRGTYIGQAPTRPSEGGPGRSGRLGGAAAPAEEKTRLAQSPLEGGRTRTEVEREPAKTGTFDFAQDGLMERGGEFERPRSTGSREALPRRETATGNAFENTPRGTGERARLPARDASFERAPRSTGERTQLPTRDASLERAPRGADERTQPSTRDASPERAPRGADERTQLPARDSLLEKALRSADERTSPGAQVAVFDKKAPQGPGERAPLPTQQMARGGDGLASFSMPAGPQGMQGTQEAGPHVPAQPLEELLPTLDEPIGMESLAHHFAEELHYLGAEIRPSRLPASERAVRLWSFFLAYAEANAKDPAGQTKEGRELFRKALTEHGFTGLRDANSGQNGVEVALAMLEARSPEELHERLAPVRIEPGPEMERLPSEVSLPVEEHAAHPEKPSTPAKAPPEQPAATRRPEAEPQKALERPASEQKAGQVFDHSEQPLQVPPRPEVPRGVVMPGVPQLESREGMDASELPGPGQAQRGTNKRLGSQMLWNVLHRFRDSPEFSAVEREKWNQVAFGALLALVGAALVVAMLASL